MNKATQREVQKVIDTAAAFPAYAAASLATLLRSASSRDLPKLEEVLDQTGLRNRMAMVNGCYVAQ